MADVAMARENRLSLARGSLPSETIPMRVSRRNCVVAWVAIGLLHSTFAALDARAEPAAAYRTETDILYVDGAVSDHARERCRLDLYHPTDAEGFPTVVWLHGGGLTGGTKEVPGALRERGFAVVGATYRLHPRAKCPEYIEDAAAAVAWTFRNIERHGGSRKRIYVSGASAGGYLAAMIGLDKRWLAAHDIDADELAGVIPLSGQMITHFTIRKERGIGTKTPVVDDLAPQHHVRADAPPLLLITGDRELEILGRYEENAYLARMMRQAGHAETTLFELDGFNHGEMAQPAFPLVVRFIRGEKPEPSTQ